MGNAQGTVDAKDRTRVRQSVMNAISLNLDGKGVFKKIKGNGELNMDYVKAQ